MTEMKGRERDSRKSAFKKYPQNISKLMKRYQAL